MNAGHLVSIVLFSAVLSRGFLRTRFWCKYVCPSGAVFPLGNLFRLTERKVESSCRNCNKCFEISPFDVIKPDFTTRTPDCTMCESCGGVCPTYAIKFVERWIFVELKVENDPPTHETIIGRRRYMSLASGSRSRRWADRPDQNIWSKSGESERLPSGSPMPAAYPSRNFCRCAFAAASVLRPAPTTCCRPRVLSRDSRGFGLRS